MMHKIENELGLDLHSGMTFDEVMTKIGDHLSGYDPDKSLADVHEWKKKAIAKAQQMDLDKCDYAIMCLSMGIDMLCLVRDEKRPPDDLRGCIHTVIDRLFDVAEKNGEEFRKENEATFDLIDKLTELLKHPVLKDVELPKDLAKRRDDVLAKAERMRRDQLKSGHNITTETAQRTYSDSNVKGRTR